MNDTRFPRIARFQASPDQIAVIRDDLVQYSLPRGRGLYIWRLTKCEGGVLSRIADRAHACGVTWVAIKCGDQGSPWSQFSSYAVKYLQSRGLLVYGWSYDVPGNPEAHAAVVRRAFDLGANGYVIDAEVEWNRHPDASGEARRFCEAIHARVPEPWPLMDAPWPVATLHPSFPFRAFGEYVTARIPQTYWTAIGGGVQRVWQRYEAAWAALHARPGFPVRPHYGSGSAWDYKPKSGAVRPSTPADMAEYERLSVLAGHLGTLHWEWSQVPDRIWLAWESEMKREAAA